MLFHHFAEENNTLLIHQEGGGQGGFMIRIPTEPIEVSEFVTGI